MYPNDVVWIYILLSPRSADFLQIQIANSLPKKLSKCSYDVKMDFSLLINKYKKDLNSGKQIIEMWNTDSLV